MAEKPKQTLFGVITRKVDKVLNCRATVAQPPTPTSVTCDPRLRAGLLTVPVVQKISARIAHESIQAIEGGLSHII